MADGTPKSQCSRPSVVRERHVTTAFTCASTQGVRFVHEHVSSEGALQKTKTSRRAAQPLRFTLAADNAGARSAELPAVPRVSFGEIVAACGADMTPPISILKVAENSNQVEAPDAAHVLGETFRKGGQAALPARRKVARPPFCGGCV